MKRTYQPSCIKRARTHGFRKRMSNTKSQQIIKRRRNKQRKYLTIKIYKK